MKKVNRRNGVCGLLAALMVALLAAGCGTSETGTSSSTTPNESAASQTVSSLAQAVSVTDKPVGFQMETPKQGEEIAVLKTSMGTMKMRLFPEEAPKAVENFKTLAKQGYYDGVVFHRVIANFMAQTGQGGGESIYGSSFEDEFSANLINLRGSVSMANAGPNTNGTQFFINQAPASTFAGWENYYQPVYDMYMQGSSRFDPAQVVDMTKVPQEMKDLYTKYGGNVFLDGSYNVIGRGHTVFGQVFEGLDVLDKITSVETDPNDRPITDITIESITFEPWEGDASTASQSSDS